MAKKSGKVSFSKVTLTKNENGEYIAEEVGKDSSKIYNLSNELDKFLDLNDLSISISQDIVLPSEEQ